jgi:hypothetical protein
MVACAWRREGGGLPSEENGSASAGGRRRSCTGRAGSSRSAGSETVHAPDAEGGHAPVLEERWARLETGSGGGGGVEVWRWRRRCRRKKETGWGGMVGGSGQGVRGFCEVGPRVEIFFGNAGRSFSS